QLTHALMRNIGVTFLLLACLPATACSSLRTPSTAELFAAASSVFRARITETKLAVLQHVGQSTEVVEARFEVREVIKGTPPASGIVRDLPFSPGNCSLGLMAGMEYVLLPGEYDLVLLPSGSFGYFNVEGTAVQSRLRELRALAATAAK